MADRGRYFVLGFSVALKAPGAPFALSEDLLRETFGDGWMIEEVCSERFLTTWAPRGVPAIWAVVRRFQPASHEDAM